jgi:acetyltransferase-like isoleucine patch superfamily enzyme
MKLAPIVLFIYNRPWHTEQTLQALSENIYADESVLYIYADGPPKNASDAELKLIQDTRSLAKKQQWCKDVRIIESTDNLGLAKSIISGVTNIVNRYGRTIVLEDDLVTSKYFLDFMNNALEYYSEDDQVMSISGYMYPNKLKLPDTFFYTVPLCWGWATWKRAWGKFNNDPVYLWEQIDSIKKWDDFNRFGKDRLQSQLAYNITGSLNTWFIKWHASVFLCNGYTLFPGTSLVDNIGFDSSGVHNGTHTEFKTVVSKKKIELNSIQFIENELARDAILQFYDNLFPDKHPVTFSGFIKKAIKKVFFKIFPEFINAELNNVVLINSYLGSNTKLYARARVSNSLIGSYTYISQNCVINYTRIGKFCSIGPNLMCGWGIHPTNKLSTSPMFYSTIKQNGVSFVQKDKEVEIKPIVIGNDVFIGMNVTILDGVTIGDGAVIGAGAVVSKDIPAYAVAVGNPIKILKYRFEESLRNSLIKIKWWEWKKDDLYLIEEHFDHVDNFVKHFTGHE